MRPLLIVLGLGLLAACTDLPAGTLPPGAGGVSPSPKPSSPVTATNLSGRWVFGSSNEPPAGPVYGCSASQLMVITDRQGTLNGTASICGGPCYQAEAFAGSNKQGKLEAAGEFKGNVQTVPETVTYSLTFDPATQHLVGTRSGKPFWAAPLVEPSKQECANVVL